MNDVIEFLTTKEAVTVYIVVLVACVLCFIVYIVEKNNDKFRRRHNTRELNKLVEQIKEEYPEEVKQDEVYNEPVLTSIVSENSIDVNNSVSSVDELLSSTSELKLVDDKVNSIIEGNSICNVEEEELEYTTIEPDQETARLELKRLTEELIRQEEMDRQEESKNIDEQPVIVEEIPIEVTNVQSVDTQDNNIELTSYEENQEATAIISLEELVQKGRQLYEANEVTQYEDEGNEPISIQDLERKMDKKISSYDEPFIIDKVVEDNNDTSINNDSVEDKKFKNSPIISPIFGIEKDSTDNELALENTADYQKLDDEIKKTNEFLMTLKELQKKLD